MDTVLDHPAYNFMIHTSPIGEEIERSLSLAHRDHSEADEGGGIRVGNGILHQPTPPEEAARFLREAQSGFADRNEIRAIRAGVF